MQKGKIPFLRRRADHLQQSVFQLGKFCLHDHPEIPFKLGIGSKEIYHVGPFYLEYGRGFNCLDIYLAFLFGIKAVYDHNPIILSRKLQVMLDTFPVHLEHPETSFSDESIMFADLVFGQNDLLSFNLPLDCSFR